jgi:hypothetical protein
MQSPSGCDCASSLAGEDDAAITMESLRGPQGAAGEGSVSPELRFRSRDSKRADVALKGRALNNRSLDRVILISTEGLDFVATPLDPQSCGSAGNTAALLNFGGNVMYMFFLPSMLGLIVIGSIQLRDQFRFSRTR